MICPNEHIGRLGPFEKTSGASKSCKTQYCIYYGLRPDGDRNSGKYDCMYGRTSIWFGRSEINVTGMSFRQYSCR